MSLYVEKPEVLQPSSNLVWGKQINHLNSTFSVTFLVAFTAEIDYRGKFHLFFFFYALLFKTIIFLPVHELLLALHGMMKLYFYSKDKPYKLNGKLHFLCSVKSPLTGWKNAILFLKEHIWKVYTLNKRKKIIF